MRSRTGWRRKDGGLQLGEAKRLRALEDENRSLKGVVANQALNIRFSRICWANHEDRVPAARPGPPSDDRRRDFGASDLSVHRRGARDGPLPSDTALRSGSKPWRLRNRAGVI